MKVAIGLIALFSMMASGFGETRTWTSQSGQAIEAEYVRDAVGSVWLKTSSGKQKRVPISALVQADQDYIYCKTLPKIRIEVDDDVARGTVGSDIDNVREEIRCTVKVIKTSKNPFPAEYEIQFFLLGYNIRDKEYILVEKVNKKFYLNSGNDNTFAFKGKRHNFEYDPDPPWGSRYEDYLVVVKAKGKVLCTKGPSKYVKKLYKLAKAEQNSRLDKDFNKSNRSRTH